MRSKQSERIHETGTGSALRRDQITFRRSSPSPEFGPRVSTPFMLFWDESAIEGGSASSPAMTASEWCELLAFNGSTTGVPWPNRSPLDAPPDIPSLRVAERSGFLCKTRANTARARFWSASLVSLPQNRPPPYPSAQARKGWKGLRPHPVDPEANL
jgi:hypothetical protein